jgi:hypothetical protein
VVTGSRPREVTVSTQLSSSGQTLNQINCSFVQKNDQSTESEVGYVHTFLRLRETPHELQCTYTTRQKRVTVGGRHLLKTSEA